MTPPVPLPNPSSASMSVQDSTIERLLRKKDWTALGKELERFRPLLRELAKRKNVAQVRSKLDHSDLVQQTYMDAIQMLPELRATNAGQLFGWLRKLLDNNFLQARRRYVATQKRSVRHEVRFQDWSSGRSAAAIQETQTPDICLIRMEQLERLAERVWTLPLELQVLLRWRFEEGLTYSDIARKLDRSEDAVRMLIQRCLKRIRSDLFSDDS